MTIAVGNTDRSGAKVHPQVTSVSRIGFNLDSALGLPHTVATDTRFTQTHSAPAALQAPHSTPSDNTRAQHTSHTGTNVTNNMTVLASLSQQFAANSMSFTDLPAHMMRGTGNRGHAMQIQPSEPSYSSTNVNNTGAGGIMRVTTPTFIPTQSNASNNVFSPVMAQLSRHNTNTNLSAAALQRLKSETGISNIAGAEIMEFDLLQLADPSLYGELMQSMASGNSTASAHSVTSLSMADLNTTRGAQQFSRTFSAAEQHQQQQAQAQFEFARAQLQPTRSHPAFGATTTASEQHAHGQGLSRPVSMFADPTQQLAKAESSPLLGAFVSSMSPPMPHHHSHHTTAMDAHAVACLHHQLQAAVSGSSPHGQYAQPHPQYPVSAPVLSTSPSMAAAASTDPSGRMRAHTVSHTTSTGAYVDSMDTSGQFVVSPPTQRRATTSTAGPVGSASGCGGAQQQQAIRPLLPAQPVPTVKDLGTNAWRRKRQRRSAHQLQRANLCPMNGCDKRYEVWAFLSCLSVDAVHARVLAHVHAHIYNASAHTHAHA